MLPPTVYDVLSMLVAFLAATLATLVLNNKFRQKLKTIVNAVESRRQLDELATTSTTKYDNPPQVSAIFIHPIKSLRAVSLSETKFDEHGLKADRRLMIVRPIPRSASSYFVEENKATHRFFTQRQSPSLATIEASEPVEITASSGGGEKKVIIKLSSSLLPQDEHVMINVHPEFTRQLPIRYQAGLWSDTVEVADLGDEAAKFVAKVTSRDDESYKDVRVVVILKSTVREVNERYCPDAARVGVLANLPQGGLTDGFPILVAAQASLDELNKRLKEKGKDQLPMSRFRPNIVISNTSKPFDEDNWKAIQIGTGPNATILHIIKGCPRCKQSCTDQLTGERGVEPLETLSDFRALGTSEEDVYFGQNAVMNGYWWAKDLNERVVSVGDPVFILTRGPPTWDSEEVQAE